MSIRLYPCHEELITSIHLVENPSSSKDASLTFSPLGSANFSTTSTRLSLSIFRLKSAATLHDNNTSYRSYQLSSISSIESTRTLDINCLTLSESPIKSCANSANDFSKACLSNSTVSTYRLRSGKIRFFTKSRMIRIPSAYVIFSMT